MWFMESSQTVIVNGQIHGCLYYNHTHACMHACTHARTHTICHMQSLCVLKKKSLKNQQNKITASMSDQLLILPVYPDLNWQNTRNYQLTWILYALNNTPICMFLPVFIVTLLGNNQLAVWFGLRRFGDGSFAWTDNSEVTFTNWDDGEPSGGVVSSVSLLTWV